MNHTATFAAYREKKWYFVKKYLTLKRNSMYIALGLIVIQGFQMSISPIQFFRQVRQEMKKVTWPTRKEVIPTCTMVIRSEEH